MSLCGLLRAIVLPYLLETACTVTACSGRPCLFVFDLLGALRLALGPQVSMHKCFQIKTVLLALIIHLRMMGLLLVRSEVTGWTVVVLQHTCQLISTQDGSSWDGQKKCEN